MKPLWSRANVELTDYWLRHGRVYKTVSICDLPTIEIQEIVSGERENHGIASLNFAEFKRLRPEKKT